MAGVFDEEKSGLSRRQMIKASAVAGAAAWTAPVIIDSLASPAAAGTPHCGPGTPNLSYGVVVYLKNGVYYQAKITGANCAGGGVNGDGSGCVNLNCGGQTWTNPSGTVHGSVSGDTTDAPSSGTTCTDLTVHNSGGWVTTNSSDVTIIFAFAHDGQVPDPVGCGHIGCVFCVTDPACAPICAPS
jgi:hypothetical protein